MRLGNRPNPSCKGERQQYPAYLAIVRLARQGPGARDLWQCVPVYFRLSPAALSTRSVMALGLLQMCDGPLFLKDGANALCLAGRITPPRHKLAR